jgi:outer membrane receptor protein involved in Fe transport
MPVVAQEQRGSIEGTVKDNTGAVLPGATIEAKSPALIGVRTTVSDSNGAYRFVSLPPGDYVISATLSGFQAAQSPTLTLTVGQNLKAELALGVGGLSEQVQVTADNTVLDLSSSQAATTISAKTIDQLPRGRTFNTLLEIAPGVRNESRSGTAGVGGYQVDGASTSENIFVVDGVDVSNLRNSSLGTQDAIPFEFLQELQIKTGGFEAQYGGALGGVINVVSKSGTDSFHGEGMYQFTGSALNSGLMYVPSQSSVIGIGPQGTWRVNPDNTGQAEFFQSPEDDYTKQYYGFTIGGPIVPNKLRFFAGYIPEQEKWDRSINFRSVGQRDSSEKILRHRGIGRADYSPSQKVQINASYFWNPQKTTGLLTGNDAKVSPPTTDLSVQGGYQPSNATNVGVNFIPTAKLLFSARYGYKYLNAKGNSYGKDQVAYYTYGRPSTFNGTVVPAQFAGPTGYANVASTLRTEKDLLTRHNLYLDATYFASIGGQNHTIKGGYALNRVGDDVVTDYTNGNFTVYWGDVFTRPPVVTAPTRGTYGYYLWDDGVRLNSAVSSRNQGFYVQDTWQVTSRLTINAGLRIENEFLPPFRAEQDGQRIADPITFGWGDKIAPRIGGAYDVRGDGKWKLSASWSRINDVLKYELARGSFGGDYWVTHAYLLNDTDLTKLSKTTPGALGPEITNYDNRKVDVAPDGHLLGIDPDIKPMATDNVDVTSDYLVTPSTTFTVRYTHKSLVRAIEDIGILDEFGSEVYTIGNPGFGETSASNKTALGASLVPKAQRDYDAMEFRLAGRIPKIFYNVSYTYSRLYGNWSGLANSDEAGRSDPNVSRAFDLSPGNIDATGHNVYGRLATDRPHVLKLFGNYMLDSKIGTTSVGVQQTAFSGTPVSSTASFLVPVFYAGRGDLGRTAFYSQTNLMVTHGFRLKGSQRVVFEAYVDNLFDQKTEIYRNTNLLATGSGNNLNGYVDELFAGTVPPLASLINPPGSTAPARNAIYNMATQFQDGRQVRLGVRFQF